MFVNNANIINAHKKAGKWAGSGKNGTWAKMEGTPEWQTTLECVAQKGDFEAVQRRVADLLGDDDVLESINFSIQFASMNGHLRVVEFLASLPGANAANKNNLAIQRASENGHLPVVEFLTSLPNVDPSDLNNLALLWAAQNGHLPVVEFLASLPGVDPAADNIIQFSGYHSQFQVVEFLQQEVVVREHQVDYKTLFVLGDLLPQIPQHLVYMFLYSSVCPQVNEEYSHLIRTLCK